MQIPQLKNLLKDFDKCRPVILSTDDFSHFPSDIADSDVVIYTSTTTKEKLIEHLDKQGKKYVLG